MPPCRPSFGRLGPAIRPSSDRGRPNGYEGGGLEGQGDFGILRLGGFSGHNAEAGEACDEPAVNGGEQRGDLRVGALASGDFISPRNVSVRRFQVWIRERSASGLRGGGLDVVGRFEALLT